MLLAFTFYFALWHSILSVRNIFSYFKSFNSTQKFTLICSKSILFSLLALGSIVGLYFGLHYFIPDMNLLFALLIVLSVLTLPHLTVMHSMYKKHSRNLNPSFKP
jgi:beta-carotene 15,15'-dioxygenase